jgi:hypothetical protein
MSATAAPQASANSSRAGSIRPYAITIFLSAFLLFLVQPIIAKQILPWFGGSAAVWTTCLVFFQSILLAGYAYADVTNRLGLRRQTMLHIALLLLSLLTLPIIASSGWKPGGEEEPIGRILLLLLVTIGLPYFLLATTTPLLQAWYWRRFETAVPYRLFALSNFASLLALLGFPVLLEPFLSLPELGWTWSGLYAIFVVICAATGWMSLRASENAGVAQQVAASTSNGPAPTLLLQLLWLVLSAMGSVMLLAVTNHVTQNISSVPFLWVLPLSLYLVTFILCFDHPRWYKRWIFIVLLIPGIPAMAHYIPSHDLEFAAILYFVGLFVACMFCHGELARLKPDPRYLTRFYLMLSLGGAIGAVLIAIVAPLTLRGYFEIGIALVALALLLFIQVNGMVAKVIALGAAIFTGYLFGQGVRDYLDDVRLMARDFYGVVRTRDRASPAPYRAMLHGSIVHGGQLLGEDFKNTASDYFGPTSGYGRLFASLPADKPRNIGVIGLGAGVIAAYGRPGDTMVFYEISPKVVDLAQREFTFLKDTHAKTELVMGDGRLSLEREAPRKYDILGIDAFSGDSIPMHLVTREAMKVYVKHLAEDGVIVFQATNRYVNLMPVIKRLAMEVGMEAVLVSDSPDHQDGPAYWYSSTDQVIVTKNRALLAEPKLKEAATPIEDNKALPTFTDHHHNLFKILK